MEPTDSVLKDIRNNTDPNLHASLFIKLVAALRPGKATDRPSEMIARMTDRMEQDKTLKGAVSYMLTSILVQMDCVSLFTRVGIHTGSGFMAEFFAQFKHRILPRLTDKRSLEYLAQRAFSKRSDYKWVQGVDDTTWIAFFRQITIPLPPESRLAKYLCTSLTILSYRVSSLALEEELNKNISDKETVLQPFLEQNRRCWGLTENYNNKQQYQINDDINKIVSELDKCAIVIQSIRENVKKYGTSLEQTYRLVGILQQIKRMRYTLHLLNISDDKTKDLETTAIFIKEIIENENKRNSINGLIQQNIGLLAYQVAEHKGNTGEHYITTDRKEYRRFFNMAMGGGAIISFIALFKTLLHHIESAPFWEYFLYGTNYALGFVLLQVTHTTLATKQPAMTASALASYLDTNNVNKKSLEKVAEAFVFVWRSQTASFVGNLIIVFPLCYLIAFCADIVFDHKLIEPGSVVPYLNMHHPLFSNAWYYACITGFFLFLTGILSGYVDNKVRFGNFAGRIREHPGLLKICPDGKRRDRIAVYIDNNLGGFTGNIFLGYCLGFAPLLGKIFGIPFDIRHITISTAQLAFGLYSSSSLPLSYIITLGIGILGIGFLNFIVSFTLAFYVAMRSRSIKVNQLSTIFRLAFQYFVRYPQDFFRAPSVPRDIEKIFKDQKNSTSA